MKILSENLDYNTYQSFLQCMPRLGNLAVIADMNNLAKALNEFNPDILLLRTENINEVVKAYCAKNRTKVIAFGEPSEQLNNFVDLIISRSSDFIRANMDILTYKEKIEKTDISIFLGNPEYLFFTEFLCKNYNVKAYGPIKVNSPKYLGNPIDVEKYEILNRSKACICFHPQDAYDSILLNVFPIMYNPVHNVDIKTFNNLISLISCMDELLENDSDKMIYNTLKDLHSKVLSFNNMTLVIDILKTLGFQKEANGLSNTLEQIKKENTNDWILD